MKRFNKVEVFKAGTHTDRNGFEKSWTPAELSEAVKKYNPETDEVPVVIGHPALDAPAYGWVKKLENEGEYLYADLDLTDEFAELVERGFFKKRSISINDDLTVNHIGFLGAKKPAVKGLKDIQFGEKTKTSRIIEFTQNLTGGNEMDINEMKGQLHEKERENLAKDKMLAEKDKTINEFSEKNKTAETENKTLKEKLHKLEREKRRGEFSAFCKEIKCLTADQHETAVDFMEILDERGAYKFAEGGEKPAVERFKEFLKRLPTAAEFGEFATRDAAGKTSDAGAKKEFSTPAGTAVDPAAMEHRKRALEYAAKHNVSLERAAIATI